MKRIHFITPCLLVLMASILCTIVYLMLRKKDFDSSDQLEATDYVVVQQIDGLNTTTDNAIVSVDTVNAIVSVDTVRRFMEIMEISVDQGMLMIGTLPTLHNEEEIDLWLRTLHPLGQFHSIEDFDSVTEKFRFHKTIERQRVIDYTDRPELNPTMKYYKYVRGDNEYIIAGYFPKLVGISYSEDRVQIFYSHFESDIVLDFSVKFGDSKESVLGVMGLLDQPKYENMNIDLSEINVISIIVADEPNITLTFTYEGAEMKSIDTQYPSPWVDLENDPVTKTFMEAASNE